VLSVIYESEVKEMEEQKFDQEKDCRTWQQKLSDAEKKVEEKVKKVAKWVVENSAVAIPAITLAAGTTYKIVRTLHAEAREQREERAKLLTTYDRTNDTYLRLRRQLTTKEKVELDERMQQLGQTKTQALYEMGLLK